METLRIYSNPSIDLNYLLAAVVFLVKLKCSMLSPMFHSSNARAQTTVGHKHNPTNSMHCVVERSKVHHRQHYQYESFMPLQVEMITADGNKIKKEPESPTSGNFPATRKMNEPPLNQQSQISVDHEHEDGDGKTSESHPFVLAPTPAQLRKALLKGRLEGSDFQQKNLKNDDMEKCVDPTIHRPSIWLRIFLLLVS